MRIGVEGADGVGKTTLVNQLLRNYSVFETVEDHPIDTFPNAVRSWWVDVENYKTKFFLYLAESIDLDRKYERREKKFPNKHILLDRSVYSHFAYTGACHESRFDPFLYLFSGEIKMPQIIIYMNLSSIEIENRLNAKGTRSGEYESLESIQFWEKLDYHYRRWFHYFKPILIYVDCQKSIDEVYDFVVKELQSASVFHSS